MLVVALFAIFHHREMPLVCGTLCNRRQSILESSFHRSSILQEVCSIVERFDDPALVWQHHDFRKADGACYPTKYSREALLEVTGEYESGDGLYVAGEYETGDGLYGLLAYVGDPVAHYPDTGQ